ncbi:integrase domain-containing protein [Curvibacter sp. RS43]|uniref:integrase domain-containing protein n=1 Tax=Curvibacter microcysteis TaxID=3026419 RepID=UPI00235E4180|nr:integrase domain-containing protein [Curvibacter sp. RS43]MDD0812859.1 integrase domain-containing protein [Curvibacter sp. RS43]
MSRNYGLGQRDMERAGCIALKKGIATGEFSFSTVATYCGQWGLFCKWAALRNIKKMENITYELVEEYGRELANRVTTDCLSAATAQNYLSAVNTVMRIATGGSWKSLSPTKNCGIKQRSAIRASAPGALDIAIYDLGLIFVRTQVGARAGSVVGLARMLGMRSKEASLFDAKRGLAEAKRFGFITISAGTKGGRKRKVPITSAVQLECLQSSAVAQGDSRAIMPPDKKWQTWREQELRRARELMKTHTDGGLHDLRSAYACQRYQELTGHAAPCAGGSIQDRAVDLAARLIVSAELGHGREEVVAEYIGGKK